MTEIGSISAPARRLTHLLRCALLLASALLCVALPSAGAGPQPPGADVRVPILLYHRLGPTAADSMTLPTSLFEAHLKYLKEHGYSVIPLRELVDYRLGRGPAPRPKSVVIVEDDAHRSVYTDMLPLVRKYGVPVTIFAYPSAISNAKYAMTWDQLRELKRTGLFDVQAHTYWHPNFKVERKRLPPDEYGRFVDSQLRRAREKLEAELGGPVDLLAWPFGICDGDLPARAAAAGYRAAFSIVSRPVTLAEHPMTLPRYLLGAADREAAFGRIVAEADPRLAVGEPRGPRG